MTNLDELEENYSNKIHSWKNDDNAQYYENLPNGTLQNFAKLGGLDTYCDLELIRPHIMQANSILEVAAGYGRVLDGLIQMGYQNKIVAIERCEKFYPLLKKYSEKNPAITTVHSDIRTFNPNEKFDLILWLWSGMCDFTREEQSSILKNLALQLHPKGIMILETMPCSVIPKNAVCSIERLSVIHGGRNSYLYVYTPSLAEVDNYAKNLGLKVQHIPYLTPTNRPRILHVLSQHTI